MGSTMIERYRRWFEYEKDSHAKVLASFEAVPAERRSSPGFQKAVDMMAHLVAARKLWLFRMGVVQESPREMFPQGVSLGDLTVQLDEMHAMWSLFLSRLSDDELRKVFQYRSYEGPWFRNSVEDILTQLFGHSWNHRGQVAALVRAIGGELAATDFVFWTREPVLAPGGN